MPERQITLTAVGEQGASTKTVRDESDGSVWWTPGDAISVFSPTNNKFVCNATEKTRTASFSGSISGQDVYSNDIKVGEIVNASGVGVVAWISDDGGAALLVSVSELQGKNWTTSNDWCSSYGDGWRMPTIDELTLIHGNFSAINAGLKSSGYTQLTTADKCYWSSTVNPTNSNYYYRERVHDGTIFTNKGNDESVSSTANYTRAVKTVLLNSFSSNPEPSYTGLYPYDETASFDGSSVTMTLVDTQTATPGSFSFGLFPAIGKSDGSRIQFYNICGGIRFSVTKSGIRRAVLRGNNGEKIAGKVKVGFSSSGLPEVKKVVNGVDHIVLEVPEDGSFIVGQNYYFVVPPTSFVNGFTIYFDSSDGIGVYNRSVSTDIKRSVISGLKDVDISVSSYTVGDAFPASDVFNPSQGGGVVAWVSNDKSMVLLVSASELRGKNWTASNDWCNSYGDGWRMPRINELTLIHENFSAINAGLKSSGYTQLSNTEYWSSTVNTTNSRCYYRERLNDGIVFTNAGSHEDISSTANYTRAVKLLNYNDFVDLGLSVCWARNNVGSRVQWDAGEWRYAWGDIKPLSYADWSMYKWCDGEINTFTKYCDNKYKGEVDNKTVLEKNDDAAFIEWGANWRMPTKDEFQELVDNCEWVWTNGGYFVISKKNGNSIFLPAGGIKKYQNKLDKYYEEGHYWSSTLKTSKNEEAFDLFFDSSHVTLTHSSIRYYGQNIRPVCPRD